MALFLMLPWLARAGENNIKQNFDLESLYRLSFKYEKAGKYRAALVAARKLNSLRNNYQTCLRLGWLYRKAGQFDKAEKAYRRALSFSPLSFDARLGLVYTLNARKRYGDALKMGRELHQIASWNTWLRRALAYAHYMLGDYEKALMHYRFMVKQWAKDPTMRTGLGLTLVKLGRREEGRAECRKALESAPKSWVAKFCIKESGWRFGLGTAFLGGRYFPPEQQQKLYFLKGRLSFSARHPGGFGFMVHGDYTSISFQQSNFTFKEFAPGVGLFYHRPKWNIWAHFSMLLGNDDAQGKGIISSFYGGVHIGRYKLGLSADVSYYGQFQTSMQFELEGAIAFSPKVILYLLPMMQLHYPYDQSNSENRYFFSFKAQLYLYLQPVSLLLSAYGGNRWFTVEDNGLSVWNSEERLVFGAKLKIQYQPGAFLSPYLSLRYDLSKECYGTAVTQHILSAVLGLRLNF